MARNIDEIIYIVSEPLSSSPVSTPFSMRSAPFFSSFSSSLFLFIISFLLSLSFFYPPSFLPVLYTYIYDVFFTFVSSFIEYLCLCVRADFFVSVSSLLFERRRIRQPFGGRFAFSFRFFNERKKKREVVPPFYLPCSCFVPPSSRSVDAFYRCLHTSFEPLFLSFPNIFVP